MSKENESIKKAGTGQEEVQRKKVDVSKLVSIIPPASELRRKEVRVREKRIRVRYDDALAVGAVKLSKELAKMLGINEGDKVEIVVAGRHKFIYTAVLTDEGGINEVYCNPEELRERGVADNSIATIRKHRGE